MVYVLISLALLGVSALLVRPFATTATAGLSSLGGNSSQNPSFRVAHPMIGFAFVGIVFLLSTPKWALAMVTAVLLHETGRYLAFRLAGHHDAVFRPFPFMPFSASSQTQPNTDAKELFVNLTGAAFSLAPMVLLHALAPLATSVSDEAGRQILAISYTIAAYNFFMLLPLWPLPGGNCARMIYQSLAPRAAIPLLIAASAVVAAYGFAFEAGIAVALCIPGAQVLIGITPSPATGRPMARKTALLALTTYLMLIVTNLFGGYQLIAWLL